MRKWKPVSTAAQEAQKSGRGHETKQTDPKNTTAISSKFDLQHILLISSSQQASIEQELAASEAGFAT